MLLALLACCAGLAGSSNNDPASAEAAADGGASADGGGVASDDGSTQAIPNCPDAWPVTLVLDGGEGEGDCDIRDEERQTWCISEGIFAIDLLTITGLSQLACQVTDAEGSFTCESSNAGAYWADDAQADGTLTEDGLTGTWTLSSRSESATGTVTKCTVTGTLEAAPR